ARNLLPSPSPLEAPATRPAMSTNSIVVGITRSGLTIAASASSRGSGTGTMPVFGSIVQNGKLAAAMPALVNALNRVDLPTLGRPTMPHLIPMLTPRFEIPVCTLASVKPRKRKPQSGPRGVQPLHGLVEITGHRQRQYVDGRVDGLFHQHRIRRRGAIEHPAHHAVLVAGMADTQTQPVALAVSEQAGGVRKAGRAG